MNPILVSAPLDEASLADLLNSRPGGLVRMPVGGMGGVTFLGDPDEALMFGCMAGWISEEEPDEAIRIDSPGPVNWTRVWGSGEH